MFVNRYHPYKDWAIRITPTDFLVIKLCQLSIRSPMKNWCALSRMADFTWEFTMFTASAN